MMHALEGFVSELRRVGIPVRLSEVVDAHRTLLEIDIANREQVRTALGAVLVKTADHLPMFEALFDLYFADHRSAPDDAGGEGQDAGQPGARTAGAADGGGGAGGFGAIDDDQLRLLLLQSLESDQDGLLRTLVAEMVDRWAGIQPGRAVAGTYYLFRTLRQVDPDQLVARMIANAPDTGSDLDRRLAADHAEERVTVLRRETEAEIRRRLVADRGADAVAKTLRTPLPEDVEFLNASREQVEQLRQVVQPMARKLAARLASKRRHRNLGQLDIRRTIRSSMSTAGIPVQPVFRHPRPAKPELVVLADISGSVSTFATFTLALAFALRTEFAKVRCFVFVDGVDEVTDVMARADNLTDVTRTINEGGFGVWMDGRSDYGHSLQGFWDRYGRTLRRRSTVLVLGDARTNYHASGAGALKSISHQAGRVFWLNPEPAAAWNSGDSVIKEYAPHCARLVECRSIRQLKAFVETLDDPPAAAG